jgi:glycosyltransferase involved in cell wall biosynthesis
MKMVKERSKILFTTPIIEHPPAGGPQLRIKNCIVALNLISELHLLSRSSADSMGGSAAVDFYTNNSFAFLDLTAFSNPRNKFLSILVRTCKKLFNKNNDDIYAAKIVSYAKLHEIDIIWFGYGNISFELISRIKKRAGHLKLVCDTDSVWSRFISRELPFQQDEKKINEIKFKTIQKELEEKYFVENCNITTAVSPVDADYYRRLSRSPNKIHIFSNAIDERDYQNLLLTDIKPPYPVIFLGGSFSSDESPMNSAARWILDCVLPIVHERLPEARLLLVGKGSDVGFANLNDQRVTATGKVQSVLPYLLSSHVSIVPLKFESGTRFKILESGICKIPIVSTTLGAEGIPVLNNINIILADSSVEFAEAIIKCINEPDFSQKLANNCFNLVRTQFGMAALVSEAEKILRALKR